MVIIFCSARQYADINADRYLSPRFTRKFGKVTSSRTVRHALRLLGCSAAAIFPFTQETYQQWYVFSINGGIHDISRSAARTGLQSYTHFVGDLGFERLIPTR